MQPFDRSCTEAVQTDCVDRQTDNADTQTVETDRQTDRL